MAKLLYTFVAGIICAVIIHIILLIVISARHREDVWMYLRDKIPSFHFIVLEQNDPVNSFRDPFFITAACVFDMADGPVEFEADGDPVFWSMSIYSTDGNSLYSTNLHTAPQGQLNYILTTPEQKPELDDILSGMETPPVTVTQNITDGFIMLRVFSPDDSWKNRAYEFIQNAHCAPLFDAMQTD